MRRITISLMLAMLTSLAHAQEIMDTSNAWIGGLVLLSGTSGSSTNGGDVALGSLTTQGAFPGDVAVVSCAGSSTSAANDPFPLAGPAGLTELVDTTNGATTARQSTSYVLATAANVGTAITCDGSGGAADATVGTSLVFRGVNQTTQIDLTTTTATGSSTNPDPASITPVTDSAVVVVSCSSGVSDASPGTVTNYATAAPGLQSANGNDTGTDQSLATTFRVLANAAAENAGAWSSWTTGQWVCATVALRPYK